MALTKMQRALAKSCICRKMAFYLLEDSGAPVEGVKRCTNKILGYVLSDMPEPQIKQLLFEILQCSDITKEEQAEALRILAMSETTLTAKQRRRLNRYLLED